MTDEPAPPRFEPNELRHIRFTYVAGSDLAYLHGESPAPGYSDEFEHNWLLRIDDATHRVIGVESTAFTTSIGRLPVVAAAVVPAIEELEAHLGRPLAGGDCTVDASPDEFPVLFRAYIYLAGYGIGRIVELDAA